MLTRRSLQKSGRLQLQTGTHPAQDHHVSDSTALIIAPSQSLTPQQSTMLALVTAGFTNENTQRNYTTALTDFFHWHRDAGFPALSRPVIETYLADFTKKQKKAKRKTTSSLIQRLAVIRRMIKIGVQEGYFTVDLLTAANDIKIVRQSGNRTGIWLNKEEAKMLLNAPSMSTLQGKRDHAILGIMLATGLRRFEVASLTFEHLQVIEDRWVISDLIGKRNRVRTVPIPDWLIESIDGWAQAAKLKEGYIFRPINRHGQIVNQETPLTPQAIRNVVARYAKHIADVAPHDLRRTFAKLAHKGGADLAQIQLSLGHERLNTTQVYLGTEQDFKKAPCDVLPFGK